MLDDYDAKAHRRLEFSCILDTEAHGLPEILSFILLSMHGRDIAVQRTQLGLNVFCSTAQDRDLLRERFVTPTVH